MRTLSKIFLIGVLAGLSSCALNPFSTARTLEQKSYALYGSFVIFEEQGAKLISDPTVPNSVKSAIQKADRDAKPVADSLKDAADSLIAIRRESADKDKLEFAAANLSRWYLDASPKIRCLVKAVEGEPCSN